MPALGSVARRARKSAMFCWRILIFSYLAVTLSSLQSAGKSRIRLLSSATYRFKRRSQVAIMCQSWHVASMSLMSASSVRRSVMRFSRAVIHAEAFVTSAGPERMARLPTPTTEFANRSVGESIQPVLTAVSLPATARRVAPLAQRLARLAVATPDAANIATSHAHPAPRTTVRLAVPIPNAACLALLRVTGYLVRSVALWNWPVGTSALRSVARHARTPNTAKTVAQMIPKLWWLTTC